MPGVHLCKATSIATRGVGWVRHLTLVHNLFECVSPIWGPSLVKLITLILLLLMLLTCATLASQETISRKLCKSSHTPLWGAPVDVKKVSDSSATLFRGHNAGVAVFSKVPARYLYAPTTCSAFISGRLLPCLIRLGPFDVLLIAVYGVPTCRDVDGKVNNEILRQAFDLASSYKIPSLIVGDLNVRPQRLDSFGSFQSLGFIEVLSGFNGRGLPCRQLVKIPPSMTPL